VSNKDAISLPLFVKVGRRKTSILSSLDNTSNASSHRHGVFSDRNCRAGVAGGSCLAVAAGGSCRAGVAGGSCRAGDAGGSCRAGVAGGSCRAVAAGGSCRAGVAGGSCRAGVAGGSCRAGVAGGRITLHRLSLDLRNHVLEVLLVIQDHRDRASHIATEYDRSARKFHLLRTNLDNAFRDDFNDLPKRIIRAAEKRPIAFAPQESVKTAAALRCGVPIHALNRARLGPLKTVL